MAAGDWNYLAGRFNGDGLIEIIETELPLDVDSLDRSLSVPSGMDGSITNSTKRLKVNGRPIFEPWNTVIIAEASGIIRGMTIYRKPTFAGSKWTLDQIGLPGYAIGQPYTEERSYTDKDPLDIFREVWRHLQSQPNGNLGLTIDDLQSPVRVGTPTVEGDNTSGPRLLNPWDTKNLGATVDEYARETPFDWVEEFSWEGDQPHCHLRLGYPTLGTRKDKLRLALGENLATEPTISNADEVNQFFVLGAGEGRDRVRGYAGVSDGKLRRATVVDDKSITSVPAANARARGGLAGARGAFVIDELDVYDHPNAPLAAIELGDELPCYAETDWALYDDYVRVIGKRESPTKNDVATLTVVRTVNV